MAKVTFDEERCKGCGLCETVCPKQIIALSKEKINLKGYHPAVITDQEKCIGCAACVDACPTAAITLGDDGKATIDAEKCISCGTCAAVCPVGAPVPENEA